MTKKSLQRALHILSGGNEPTVTKENYKIELIRALNWYNANREEKDYRSYLHHFLKSNKAEYIRYIRPVGKAKFQDIRSIAILVRLAERGQYVAPKDFDRVQNTLQLISDNFVEVVEDTVEITAPKPSIQDRVQETAQRHASDIDAEIDRAITEKVFDFSTRSYLVSNNVSGMVSKRIGQMYEIKVQQVTEALSGTDAQLKEAYSFFTKHQLKKYLSFLQQIITDCQQQVVSAKVNRKPPVRKPKSPSVVASKIKPMRIFADLNLKSIDPAKIIDATELWVYTPKLRQLTVYYGAALLGVSRTSITNYDVEKSCTKTIRKPEEFFKKLTSTGKRAMANAWDSINSKGRPVKSRISNDMILLAAN